MSSTRAGAAAAAAPPPASGGASQFPAGLRVLVVDDDSTCLKIVERMLCACLYEVTICSRAVHALSILRERKGAFDLVLSDVHMPDMDGFKLLEHIGLEMDLPVIMMSVDDGKDVVMKGVTHGTVDYLIKPVSMEALKNIWQHVVRKRKNEKSLEQTGSGEENDKQKKLPLDEGDNVSSANESNWKNVKRRKEDKEEEDEADEREDTSTLKKPRVVWTVELHQQFVQAVNQLGVDKAVPKKILELMNVPGITRENVASHLQKYRLYLRRVSGPQPQGRLDTTFQGASDATTYSQIGPVNGFGIQGLGVPGQIPQNNNMNIQAGMSQITNTGIGMSVVDQMNYFSPNHQPQRMVAAQQWTSQRQRNLISGSAGNTYGNITRQATDETSCFLNTLSTMNTNSPFSGNAIAANPRNALMMQMRQQGQLFSLSRQEEHVPKISPTNVQQLIPSNNSNDVFGIVGVIENGDKSFTGAFPNASFDAVPQALYPDLQNNFINELTGNSYPLVSSMATPNLTSTGTFQEATPAGEALDIKVKDLTPSYDIFNELHQNKNQEWTMQNMNLPIVKQTNIDFGPISAPQDLVTARRDGNNRNTCTVSKEIFSIRTETESGKVECFARHNSTVLVGNSLRVTSDCMSDLNCPDILFSDTNELMNMISKQQEGVGEVEPEFSLDGYSFDDISV